MTGVPKRRIAAVLVSGVLAITPLTPSQAHNFNANTSVTIHRDKPNFFGKVKSGRNFCKKNRLVKLFRKRPNGNRFFFIAKTRSNDNGNWSIRKQRVRGKYFVKVKRKRQNSHGHSHRCRPAQSRTLTLQRGD